MTPDPSGGARVGSCNCLHKERSAAAAPVARASKRLQLKKQITPIVDEKNPPHLLLPSRLQPRRYLLLNASTTHREDPFPLGCGFYLVWEGEGSHRNASAVITHGRILTCWSFRTLVFLSLGLSSSRYITQPSPATPPPLSQPLPSHKINVFSHS